MSVKWGVSVSTAMVVILSQSPAVLLFVLGAAVNAVCTKIVKHSLRVPRPATATLTDPGFPSSHASSLAFFGTSLAASTLAGDLPVTSSPLLAAMFPAVAVALAWTRVTKGLHSVDQVVGGLLFGAVSAVVWHLHSPVTPAHVTLGPPHATAKHVAVAGVMLLALSVRPENVVRAVLSLFNKPRTS